MDDTSIPLRSIRYIPTTLDIIHKFGRLSGGKLNISKTKGIVLKKENAGTHYGIDCIYNSEKVLGIYIGNKVEIDQIWQELYEKTDKKLTLWQKRDLSMSGKVLIIKTLAISKIIYNLNMQCFTDVQLEQFNKLLYKFLWNGKQHFISKTICEENKINGGLSMPNCLTIKKCVRIQWVLRTLTNHLQSNDRTSTIIPMQYFKCMDAETNTILYALRVDSCSDKIQKLKIPQFYKECITSFQELLRKSKTMRNRNNEIIWDNSDITHNNKVLRNKKWTKRGILTKQHICIDNKINEQLIKSFGVNDANFMFDLALLKKAIPQNWLDMTQSDRTFTIHTDNEEETTNQIINLIINQTLKLSEDKIRIVAKLTANEIKQILRNTSISENLMTNKQEYWHEKIGLQPTQWRHFISCTSINKLLPRKINDFNLKIVHGGLNTETKLQKMGLNHDNICKICKKTVEDTKHLLMECEGIPQIWTWAENIINNYLTNNEQYVISIAEKTCGYRTFKKTDMQDVITVIVSIIRHEIWKRRCKYRYGNEMVNTDTLLLITKSSLQRHLKNIRTNIDKNSDKMDNLIKYLTHKPP